MRRFFILALLFVPIGAFAQVSNEIENLKRQVPSERVVSAYVQLRDEGANLSGRCPFHDDRTPSMKVKKADGFIKCFGCGWSGDQIDFLGKILGISKSEAIGKLREMAGQKRVSPGWERSRQIFTDPIGRQRETRTIGHDEWAIYVKKLWSDGGADGRRFLSSRGIADETAKRFNLGLREGESLFGRGATEEEESRLRPMRDMSWLGIPYVHGDRIALIKWRVCGELPSGCNRYFTAKGMATSALFNQATIDPLDMLYVCEGEIDAMTLEQAGFRACSLHNASHNVSPQSKDEMVKAETVFVAGDNEASGIGNRAMERLLRDLGENAHPLIWPRGEAKKKDANAFFLEDCGGNIDAFRQKVLVLSAEAAKPSAPHFVSVHDWIERLRTSGSPLDDPLRLRFPWAKLDRMALVIPGDIVAVFARHTGTGKSAFVTQVSQNMAINHGKTVAIYTPDLKPLRHSRLLISQLARKHRLKLDSADYDLAASKLPAGSVYLGYDPSAKNANDVLELCECAVRRLGVDILVIDSITFIVTGVPFGALPQATAETVARLNAMAEKYRITIILTVESNRPPQQPGKPKDYWAENESMKNSAAIEHASSTVFSLFRKRLGQPKNEDEVTQKPDLEPRTLVRMTKGREQQGSESAAWLYFHGEMALFTEEEN